MTEVNDLCHIHKFNQKEIKELKADKKRLISGKN